MTDEDFGSSIIIDQKTIQKSTRMKRRVKPKLSENDHQMHWKWSETKQEKEDDT